MKRLNFATLSELVFDSDSEGETPVVQQQDEHFAMLGEMDMVSAPKSIKAAYSSPEAPYWKEAIAEEMGSIQQNGVLTEPIQLPPGSQSTPTKMLFVKKLNSMGAVERYKARLVYSYLWFRNQIDWGQIFAPVVDKVSIRFFWAVCASMGYSIMQLDIKTAFLYGDCLKEIYVTLAPELQTQEEKDQGLVRRMVKSLYGTPDAPRIWYSTLASFLSTLGFSKCEREGCIFKNPLTGVIIMVYVDDLAVAGPSPEVVQSVVSQLEAQYSMRKMGTPTVFLGINLQHFKHNKLIHISQSSYIRKLVEKYGLQMSHPKATPMPSTLSLEPLEEGEDLTQQPFRGLVGELLYISVCTRPDISFAVATLSKFLDKAGDSHWNAAIQVLLYLKGTLSYGIPLGGRSDITDLKAYVDADYANDKQDYRSVSGYLVFVGDSLISWMSNKDL